MSAAEPHLYHQLQQAAHRVQKAADRALLEAAGVTTAQAAVLAIIGAGSGVSQRDVARQLGVNESAMTAMANRLTAAGLLQRGRSSDDARAWRLDLTDAGRESLRQLRAPFREINDRLRAALPGKDVEQMSVCLNRVNDAFQEPSDR
jgi:DNA-binding MarR family transcriptional regulator